MDPSAERWMETFREDCHRETDGGRDDFEEPWYWSSTTVPEDLGDYQESGDDVRRRERVAQAIYEC